MTKNRFTMPIFTAIILRNNNSICLLKRSSSLNVKLHSGFYAIPGGGVDGKESITQATIREALEEIGVTIDSKYLELAHVLHVKTEAGDEYINFFMETNIWLGNPMITEPEKCDEVAWFELNNLPKNLMPMHKHVFEMINQEVL